MTTHKEGADRKVWTLLIDVAHAAPLLQNKYAYEAKISWRLIDRIRTFLDAQEIPWRTYHPQRRSIGARFKRRARARKGAPLVRL